MTLNYCKDQEKNLETISEAALVILFIVFLLKRVKWGLKILNFIEKTKFAKQCIFVFDSSNN